MSKILPFFDDSNRVKTQHENTTNEKTSQTCTAIQENISQESEQLM